MNEYNRALCKVADQLNDLGVTWAVGASTLLYMYGLVSKPKDIDILVSLEHRETVRLMMSTLGTIEETSASGAYRSEMFIESVVEGIEVDLIGGFTIVCDDTLYTYPFGGERIGGVAEFHGSRIPLGLLEDWYVLYTMMGDPKERIPILRDYFLRVKDEKCMERLMDMVNTGVPEYIRSIIESYVQSLDDR